VCASAARSSTTPPIHLYWSPSNTSGTEASALSYIPEVAWNESTAGGLWASGGGASTLYPKPSWQTGTGVPADGKRDVPDISLTSAGHDGYLIYQNGGLYVVGGTSAASASFAAVMALVVQNAAARQDNANTGFYSLASKQRAGGASVCHDITSGNNSVPGHTGFNATPGYDQATGLGSIAASVVVSHWSDATAAPTYRSTASSNFLAIAAGSNDSIGLNVTVSGSFNAAIAFSVRGLASRISAQFTPATLSVPGSGTSVLKLTATTRAKPGTYYATVSASSGSTTQKIPLAITCRRHIVPHR